MIRSPIRGIVTERLMSAGEFVRQDSAIFTLVQLDPLYVEGRVAFPLPPPRRAARDRLPPDAK